MFRKFLREIAIRLAVYGIPLLTAGWYMIRMPGVSGTELGTVQTRHDLELEQALRRDVATLAGEIGERNVEFEPLHLAAAAEFVERSFLKAGYTPHSQSYLVGNVSCRNIEVEIRGTSPSGEIVVIGAHYDSVPGSPGADDNATGVAALLALARKFAGAHPVRTLRFVAFTNEEPPYFWTEQMGSNVYARECRRRGDRIAAMVSLESLGTYGGPQRYPFPLHYLYPATGNFVGFVGNLSSRTLVHQTIAAFRQTTPFPSEGASLPNAIPGVGWSDHWSFWRQGYRAIEITDTAPYRNMNYHTPQDSPDKIDYPRMASVVAGLERVVEMMAAGQ